MGKRQQQHMGRSVDDATQMEGRDINADAPEGMGASRVSADQPSADEARRIARLLEQDQQDGQPHHDASGD
jgi:hypothetical protein